MSQSETNPKLDLASNNWTHEVLKPDGPTCLIIRAWLTPVAGLDRFQPAGFPEMGHVIYDAPRKDATPEKVCIVDSPASMANHLEAVCLNGPTALHPDLDGLPYVKCVTDHHGDTPAESDAMDTQVCTTLTEGHRLASDYFLDSLKDPKWSKNKWEGTTFRESLRTEFGIKEVKKDKTYFAWPDTWWQIYKVLFRYDPNSLVHGVLFAKEQIKISRLLTAHHEAFGAARVGRSGVKFDRLQKTTSGQPIFAVEDETADEIRATFIIDLALLRSYGRGDKGLNDTQKRLLLELAVWKVKKLLEKPFRYRSGCHLACEGIEWLNESDMMRPFGTDDASQLGARPALKKPEELVVDIKKAIDKAGFDEKPVTSVYYASADLFKLESDKKKPASGASIDFAKGGNDASPSNEEE